MRLSQLLNASAISLLLAFSQQASSYSGTAEPEKFCTEKKCQIQIRQLAKLAKEGSGRAAAIVAMAYASGDGIEKDLDKAEHYITLGARFRDPVAAYLMADWLRNGFVLKQDAVKADEMQNLAIKYGYAPAMYDKALTLFKTGDPQNNAQAVTLLENAADENNVNAMFLLARMKQQGVGTDQDTEGAADLFKKLARARHPESIEYLQTLLENANNNPQHADILASIELDKDIEVIEVTGEKLQVSLMLEGLIDNLVESGKYDKRSIGSRIRGVSCGETVMCGGIRPNQNSHATSVIELITNRKRSR